MRDYLFHGKRKDNGEWVEGCGIIATENWVSIFNVIDDIDENSSEVNEIEILPETVGQYTGLTDKNGVRIFEGDIFKFDDEVWESSYTSCGTEYDSFAVENYGVVGFDEEMARFDFIKYKFSENSVEADLHENHTIDFSEFVCELEIIGNIHDNPELLKGGEGE